MPAVPPLWNRRKRPHRWQCVDGMRMHHANCSYFHQLWFADCLLFSCFCLLTDDGVASATLSPPRKKSQIAKAQEPASHPQPHACSTSIMESEKAATPLTVDGMRICIMQVVAIFTNCGLLTACRSLGFVCWQMMVLRQQPCRRHGRRLR